VPGIVAAAIVAHVPTLGLPQNTPDYQQTLVEAERTLGAAIRDVVKPDLWVVVSAHWVATFDWLVTCQPVHDGVCVADEAPNLIPGSAYHFRGDPAFAGALVEAIAGAGLPAARNDSPHYAWDYGTFVPMQYLDPSAELPVVCLPSVLMATHEECLRAGALVHATACRLGRRVVLVASTAFSHVLQRGRHHWPAPRRIEADHRFIDGLKAGRLDEAIAGFAGYSREVGAELGGRPLATLLGAGRAMEHDTGALAGRQFGAYAQSSGSGNAVLLLAATDMLRQLG
jgi:3,4-dihydroxyphenylacetate 2,3-dioxygenase